MLGKFILDTNIIIAFFARQDHVISKVQMAREIVVPAIVLGELYYGARKSARTIENLERLDIFALKSSIMTVDTDTAREYGQLKDELRAKGSPIPENDIWIAALARQHGIALVSRDEHFKVVDDIELIAW
ncbi:MAG: type II toxin-antitoxin system VapC family toxin [Lentisphaeria bacterium]|nr:type II toxin-antitoxin system VapC family toxin [Lentisphaeria bacterium]